MKKKAKADGRVTLRYVVATVTDLHLLSALCSISAALGVLL